MKTYFDTSFLLPAYLPEAGTEMALKIIQANPPPAPFTHLLELELRNAMRMKHGRGEASAATMRGALQALESDLAKGLYARPDYDLETVYRRAEILSAKHTAATIARAADIWHVAAALEIGCKAFASFDGRQRTLAALAGLDLMPAKIAKRKP
jgi:predicted nucleic acid-binding protein